MPKEILTGTHPGIEAVPVRVGPSAAAEFNLVRAFLIPKACFKLEDAHFNVRLFSMPTGSPPDKWKVRTYVTSSHGPRVKTGTRTSLSPANSFTRFVKRQTARARGMDDVESLAGRWLAKILREWQPDIVHTLGIEQGGEFFLHVRRRFGLEAIGKNLFLETAASGDPQEGIPGEEGFGSMQQGALELSNVNIVNEITKMIAAQRAYEMNSKVIQTSDEMMGTISNLR